MYPAGSVSITVWMPGVVVESEYRPSELVVVLVPFIEIVTLGIAASPLSRVPLLLLSLNTIPDMVDDGIQAGWAVLAPAL